MKISIYFNLFGKNMLCVSLINTFSFDHSKTIYHMLTLMQSWVKKEDALIFEVVFHLNNFELQRQRKFYNLVSIIERHVLK